MGGAHMWLSALLLPSSSSSSSFFFVGLGIELRALNS
jgi:hypothetical protein